MLRTLFVLALIGVLMNESCFAEDRVPVEWDETDGNPMAVDGEPRWRADRVWPDDPGDAEAYVTMPWRDGSWKAKDHEHGGQPRITVSGGTVLLSARSSGGGKNQGLKIPALVYIVPETGWYGLKADATTKKFQGRGELKLQLARRSDGQIDMIQHWMLKDGQTQSISGVAVQANEGDELVLMVIANRAGVDVRLRGLAIGSNLVDQTVRSSRQQLAALDKASVNANPSKQQILQVNQAVLDAGEGGMVFPADSLIANVRAYGAVGDGKHDDTAAFQAAFSAKPKRRLIYVPNGTYLITDKISWGERQTRQILQGQSRDGTIIKLMDRAPGFTDKQSPREMFWTGDAPAQRFRNGVRDLTIDVGAGNAGAIGLRFHANNQGNLTNLLVRSSDPEGIGHIGVDMGYTGEIGPLLIQGLTVEGFDTGVYSSHAVNSITGDGVTLRGQNKVGWLNDGQVVSLRNLVSHNAVPAFHNREQASVLTLLDSKLTGVGDASQHAAIINRRGLFARNVDTTGYASAVENHDGTKQGVSGNRIDEFVSHGVLSLFDGMPQRSLNLPIKDAPAIEWHDLSEWKSVADFKPEKIKITMPNGKPREFRDWSPALQQAIDSGAKTIYFPAGRGQYQLLSEVIVRGNVERIIGLEQEFRGAFGPLQAGHKATIVFRNQHPVIFERFDAIYTGTQFRHEGNGLLILRHLAMNEYNGLVKVKGSGDVFIEDCAFGGTTVIEGGNVWARQFNPEGEVIRTKVDNAGGNFWVLGYKTEGDTLLVNTRDGGRSEIAGSFIYANKANDPDKVMFKFDETSSMSFTMGEWVGRRQPFAVVEQTHDGETRRLQHGEAYYRGEGSLVPLFVGTPDPK